MSKVPRLLFSSVFKPFAEADNLYSRVDSKIEISTTSSPNIKGCSAGVLHYSTFGLHTIANNLEYRPWCWTTPPCHASSPGEERLRLRGDWFHRPQFSKGQADVCRDPAAQPEIQGHHRRLCATIEHLDRILDVDYICSGEGISFMRELLGLPAGYEFRMPDCAAKTAEIMGVPFFWDEYRPVMIVGLGCPYGL